MRISLKESEAKFLGIEPKSKSDTRNPRYTLSEEQYYSIQNLRGLKPNHREFVETIKKTGKNGELLSVTEKLQSEPIAVPDNFKIIKISTSKTTGQQWIQYAPKEIEAEVQSYDFENIIKKHIKKVDVKKVVNLNPTKDFQTCTYTDVHIGMDTNKYKNSMYPILWNKEEALKSAKMIVDDILANIESKVLVVDELGDLLDGFNGFTTRGGHELPQNMTNEEAFDCALEFKMYLLDNLVPYFEKIIFNNICNDNHAGAFGYFVNKSFKELAELKYDNIEVVNHRQFINHYFIGDICFVITHGKDDKTLKFGFKPQLDAKQIEKIDQYLKHNGIYKKAKLIVFKKGDSHQALFDMCTSDDFYYFNYPALSPSSQWVQNNFKKGRRGYILESYKNERLYLDPVFITKNNVA